MHQDCQVCEADQDILASLAKCFVKAFHCSSADPSVTSNILVADTLVQRHMQRDIFVIFGYVTPHTKELDSEGSLASAAACGANINY